MTHRAAWRLSAWLLLLALLLVPTLALAAPATDGSPCRRLEAAGEVNRRCARADADDHTAECRRLWGTDDYTRRCAQAAANADLAHTCRRIVNAGQWTRRCLPVYPGGPGAE